MIYDKLSQSERYDELSPRIGKLLRYLRSHDLTTFPEGRVELEDDKLYFTISMNQTKDPAGALLEAHKHYADLQYLISGEEIFGVAFMPEGLEPFESKEERDVYFYEADDIPLTLGNDKFIIVFPDELHRPGVDPAGGKQMTKKLVAKILID